MTPRPFDKVLLMLTEQVCCQCAEGYSITTYDAQVYFKYCTKIAT